MKYILVSLDVYFSCLQIPREFVLLLAGLSMSAFIIAGFLQKYSQEHL